MIRRAGRWFAAAVVASTLVACGDTAASGPAGGDRSGHASAGSAQRLQWRLVTSASPGPCAAPALTTAAAGPACGIDGATTYKLGPLLGSAGIAGASVVRRDATGEAVILAQLDTLGTASFASVTKRELRRRLALLLGGRVVAAPLIEEPIVGGRVQLRLATADALRMFADKLTVASTTSAPPPVAASGSLVALPPTGFAAERRRVCEAAQPRLAPGMSFRPGTPAIPVTPAYVVAFATRLHDHDAAELWRRQPAAEHVYACVFSARPGSDLGRPSCPPGQVPQLTPPDERVFFVDARGTSTEWPHDPEPSTRPPCGPVSP